MEQLVWGGIGDLVYELGIDRGVLYVDGKDGVPWNGLVSVSESPKGGESKPYYLDGIKYLNRASPVEYTATIEAYTYPEEFAECDGTELVENGLFATAQRRKSFGLSYRTKIANDVDGLDHGYKIHLIYNASATPSQRANNTMSESVEPYNFSWQVTTVPVKLDGHKPTAHYIIDSRKSPAGLLGQIEEILYGNSIQASRLPTVGELKFLFTVYTVINIDAGSVLEPFYKTYDAGIIPEFQNETIDGGSFDDILSNLVYDGGTPMFDSSIPDDGGTPSLTGTEDLDGGTPGSSVIDDIYDGATTAYVVAETYDGGTAAYIAADTDEGGTP